LIRALSFQQAEAAWYQGVAAIARAGAAVIADEMFLDGGGSQARLAAALQGLTVICVGVRRDPDVAQTPGIQPGDRIRGQARDQALRVYQGVRYDLVVDTTRTASSRCAGTATSRRGHHCHEDVTTTNLSAEPPGEGEVKQESFTAGVSRRPHHDGDVDDCHHQCGHEYPDQYPDGGVVLHVIYIPTLVTGSVWMPGQAIFQRLLPRSCLAHRGVGQADDGEAGEPVRDMDLDRDGAPYRTAQVAAATAARMEGNVRTGGARESRQHFCGGRSQRPVR
jgi:hypothetical protein